MNFTGDRLIKLKKHRKQAVVFLGPLIIIILAISLAYEPYMKQIDKLKDEHKEKKALFRKYQERIETIPKLEEELKRLQERLKEATKKCLREKNSEEAKSKFFQMVFPEAQALNLNVQEPAVETYGEVDIFTTGMTGRVSDLKPFLLLLEKLEKSDNVFIESMDIKVEDPNNPANLQVNLRLLSCNLRASP